MASKALKVAKCEELRHVNAWSQPRLLVNALLVNSPFALVEWEGSETALSGPASKMRTSDVELPGSLWGRVTFWSCWAQPGASWMVGRYTPFPDPSTGLASHRHTWPWCQGMVMWRQAASLCKSWEQIDHWCPTCGEQWDQKLLIVMVDGPLSDGMVWTTANIVSAWTLNVLVSGQVNTNQPHTFLGIEMQGPNSQLGNLVTGFMISEESGNRFFLTAVTDYWQDRAGIVYQQTEFSEISQICTHLSIWNCESRVTLPFKWVWVPWNFIICIYSFYDKDGEGLGPLRQEVSVIVGLVSCMNAALLKPCLCRAATFVPPSSDQKIDQDDQWSPKPRKFCFCVTAAARPLCIPWTTKTAAVTQ